MNALVEIKKFIDQYRGAIRVETLETVYCDVGTFNVELLELSVDKRQRNKPFTLLLVAGCHGLEAIGVTVLLHHFAHVLELTRWNHAFQQSLQSVRVVAIPALNPCGIALSRRANAQGIDLMRNAPVHAESPVPFLGGQTLTPILPYYRGNGELAPESRALISAAQKLLSSSSGMIALDLHSGFGARDRIWTPWSMSSALPPHWDHYVALEKALNESFPDHVYTFEQQSHSYQTDGDLWDYILMENLRQQGPLFLPLTLEMGSWNWLKKAPWRAFSKMGWFHPVSPHRVQRVCRRHITLLDFLVSVSANAESFFKFN
ncbi:DUF2817 domain-containing protein [bacterium]|nr:DUF2817 domain-containing protein [bacterium]